ncbi:hypothetical protein DM794_20170 [Paenarthrobacter ureafaciens]|nr:hypothetical protein [Paenarthrobacter ureafaciens]QSZ51998.1 hypothetical protein AYX19_02545 [Paenarthrobacter ureafaciens]
MNRHGDGGNVVARRLVKLTYREIASGFDNALTDLPLFGGQLIAYAILSDGGLEQVTPPIAQLR